MMSRVTGTGCTATAINRAFMAVQPDPLNAAATGLAYFGLAGEEAAAKGSAPVPFRLHFSNALYEMRVEELEVGARIQSS